jgi:molybdopterin molybdotransferase
MPEFLELIPPQDALQRLFDHMPAVQPRVERIETIKALGKITAEPVISSEQLPAFSRSTVDGYAIRSVNSYGASESLPSYLEIIGEIPMGASPLFSLESGQTAIIHTGGMLPHGADAVIMLENTQFSRPGEIEVLRAVAPNENILLAGEDFASGDIVLPAGSRLRPAEIGGLVALGIMSVWVTQSPRIGIISTGDEIIFPESTPEPGQIRDINSYTLSALVQQAGALPVRFGIVPDWQEALQATLLSALNTCDAVVITAGSSASARDLTSTVIQNVGSPGVLVHGVNIRPGKPTILAVCDGKAVIGLPGNPVSALVIADLFVIPVIERLSGLSKPKARSSLIARLTINISSQAGRDDWVPVKLIQTPEGTMAEPIFYKSNLIFSLVRADGLAHIPASATGFEIGDLVNVYLL